MDANRNEGGVLNNSSIRSDVRIHPEVTWYFDDKGSFQNRGKTDQLPRDFDISIAPDVPRDFIGFYSRTYDIVDVDWNLNGPASRVGI